MPQIFAFILHLTWFGGHPKVCRGYGFFTRVAFVTLYEPPIPGSSKEVGRGFPFPPMLIVKVSFCSEHIPFCLMLFNIQFMFLGGKLFNADAAYSGYPL